MRNDRPPITVSLSLEEDHVILAPAPGPFAQRFGDNYRRQAFDKLRALDLVLAEFQQLLGHGEVIAEAEDGSSETREVVLLVEWLRPLHVVMVVDSACEEERLVTVYEPDPSIWTADFRWRR